MGLGGFVGANLRYWLGLWVEDRTGATFPWHTLMVNVSGSILIGVFMGLFFGLNLSLHWRLLVGFGILGGYTTFSTFSYEVVGLMENRHFAPAMAYVASSTVLSVLGAWIGLWSMRLLVGRG